jgi:hypothetical protein
VPVKRLAVIGLTCLLSACVSSLADLRQDKADKVGDFPVAAFYLSSCVYHAMKTRESPSDFRLKAHADELGFSITATWVSAANTTRERAALDLRFLAHDQTTSVELREGGRDGWVQARQAWPLIERCSQQLERAPGPNPTAP